MNQDCDIAETRRQALRLLRKLSQPGAALTFIPGARGEPHGARADMSPGAVVSVAYSGRGNKAKSTSVSGAAFEFARAQDWLDHTGEVYTLSAVGRASLRRAMASGDAFQAQHRASPGSASAEPAPGARPAGGQDPGRGSGGATSPESPLAWLRRRRDRNGVPLIDDAQYAAGERLRSDHAFALLTPSITSSWTGVTASRSTRRGPSSAGEIRDDVLAARERVRSALEGVGPELNPILVDVCCQGKGLEPIEKERAWPQRCAKVVLGLALTCLARHYGYVGGPYAGGRRGEGVSRGGRALHWGAPDYRPKASPIEQVQD